MCLKLGVSIGKHHNLPIATCQIKVKLLYSLSFLDDFVPRQFLNFAFYQILSVLCVYKGYMNLMYYMGEMAFYVGQIAIFVK